jgi:hypothetical protein
MQSGQNIDIAGRVATFKRALSPRQAVLKRELWLAVHADLAGLPRIAAVTGWIEELVAERGKA